MIFLEYTRFRFLSAQGLSIQSFIFPFDGNGNGADLASKNLSKDYVSIPVVNEAPVVAA